jgi:hypothetical protein
LYWEVVSHEVQLLIAFEQVLHYTLQAVHIPSLGTRFKLVGHSVKHELIWKTNGLRQEVQVDVVLWHVKQALTQKSQKFVNVLPTVIPVGHCGTQVLFPV